MTRGMGWGSFWLIFIIAFFYMIWAVLYGANSNSELKVTEEAARLAPVEAIDGFMTDIEAQGYFVEHTKDLEQDPENVNRVIIEYRVSRSDNSEQWIYAWAREVPAELTSELFKGLPAHVQNDLIPIPLSKYFF